MLIDVNEYLKTDFDVIFDARSPGEYNESHIPESRNFYVLNDKEHAEIGYVYKQISKKEASKKGLVYILRNIAKQLEEINIEDLYGKKVLVYCARGGKRSEALYTILKQLNLNVFRLKGGYKAYRSYVSDYFQNLPHKNFIVLRGNSGCGKSELIERLSPSIDLEKFANHYGSTFGNRGVQPSQKMFENMLFENFRKIDENEYVFIEAESSKIGKILIPGMLKRKIEEGVQVEITAPLEQRIERTLKYYGNIDKENFYANLEKLKKFISKETYEKLIENYNKGNLKKVAEIMLLEYYDRVYKRKEADFVIENVDLKKSVEKLLEIKKICSGECGVRSV